MSNDCNSKWNLHYSHNYNDFQQLIVNFMYKPSGEKQIFALKIIWNIFFRRDECLFCHIVWKN